MIYELLNLLVKLSCLTEKKAISLRNMKVELLLRYLVTEKLIAHQDVAYILKLLYALNKTSSEREKNNLRSKLLNVLVETMHIKIAEVELGSEVTRKRVTSREWPSVRHLTKSDKKYSVKPDKNSND